MTPVLSPDTNSPPTFEVGTGLAISPIGPQSGSDQGHALALLPDGRLLVAGSAFTGTHLEFALQRFNADGKLDASFNGTGQVMLDFGLSGNDEGFSVALQPDGKVLVGGRSFNGVNYDFGVARFNSDGSLDTSFGGAGRVLVPIADTDDHGLSLALAADGKVLVCGYTAAANSYDFAVARLNSDGSLDSTFNGSGVRSLAFGSSYDVAQTVLQQADGKIVLVGTSNITVGASTTSDFVVTRLNSDGSFDSSFGGSGYATINFGAGDGAHDALIQPDDKILVSGFSYLGGVPQMTLARLNPDGTPDSSFNQSGKASVALGDGAVAALSYAVALQADGSIVVAGTESYQSGERERLVVARFDASGNPDVAFGEGGKVTFPVSTFQTTAGDVVVQPDGKIVITGSGRSLNMPFDTFVLRLHADGTADRQFGASDTLGGTVPYVENGAPVALDLSVSVFDADLSLRGDYGGSSILVRRAGGASADDVLTGIGGLTIGDGKAMLSGVQVGTTTTEPGALQISFLSGTSEAAVNQVLSSIGYANSSDSPPATVQIEWAFLDGNSGAQGEGGPSTATGTTRVDITRVNDPPVGAVTIDNSTPQQGDVLTASHELTDPDGMGPVSYHWSANGAPLFAATENTLRITQAEVGKAIAVVVTYQDAAGTRESFASAPTEPVGNVNDAPLLSSGASTVPIEIHEDAHAPNPLRVADLLADGSVQDADGGGIEAIAVIGTDQTLGTWHYSLDSGMRWSAVRSDIVNGTWTDMGLLLGPDALLRFVPHLNMNGTSAGALTFRAWDMSAGTAGTYVDSGTVGGTSALSATAASVSVTVTAENDAPVFALQTGRLTTDFTGGAEDEARAVAIQADGRLIVAGRSGGDIALARYLPDGSLDLSFGSGGKVVTNLGSSESGTAVRVDANGKITVAGAINGNFAMLQYNADGTLDRSFGRDGAATADLGAGDTGNGMAVQADGKFVVAGTSGRDFGLARFDIDGTLDTTFGNGGKVLTDFGGDTYEIGWAVAVQSDGNIVVGGTSATGDFSTYQFALARYRPDGTLDPLFGGGKVTVPVLGFLDIVQAITVQPDGKIVAVGFSNYNVALLRLNGDGTPDARFGGGDGVATANLGGYENPLAVALQADGKILVAGENNNNFFLTRFNTDGTHDTSFARGFGVMMIDLQGGSDSVTGLLVQPDGKIVAVGRAGPGSSTDFAVARFDADGMPDPAFGEAWTPRVRTYVEGGTPATMDPSARVYDFDMASAAAGGDYNGAVLTLQRAGGPSAEDVFTATAPLVFVDGRAVLSGVDIGAVTMAEGVFTLTFGANATQARVDGAVASLAYASTSDRPPAEVEIEWTFSDGNAGSQGSGGALTATRTTVVNITAVNDAPTGNASAALADGTEDTDYIVSAARLLEGFSDVDGDALSVHDLVADRGSVVANGDGTFTIAPERDYSGAVVLTYDVQDVNGGTVRATQTFILAPVNDTPVLTTDAAGSVAEDAGVVAGYVAASGSLRVSDADPGDVVSIVGYNTVDWSGGTLSSAQASALSSVFSTSATNWTYRVANSELQFLGAGEMVTVTYHWFARDDSGALNNTSNEQVVTITLTGANDAPTGGATALLPAGTEDANYRVAAARLLEGFSDVDGDALSVHDLVADRGSVFVDNDGTLTIAPAPNYNGPVLLRYLVLDSMGGSVAGSASFTLTAVNDTPTGTVTITGMSAQGETLTASNTVADVDGLGEISYQWRADGVQIEGATASTLQLGQALVGKAVSVVASYGDGGGTQESVASSATAAVANVNDAPSGVVTISGAAIKGQTLTAGNTLADADGLGPIGYQWQADGVDITGATDGSYVLTQADVGKTIALAASYTDLWGTAERVSSSATAPVTQTASTSPGTSTDGDDTLQSTTGNAVLAGGLGNDTYIIAVVGVTVREAPGAGNDLVQSSVSYSLDANVENLTLTGASRVNGTGNELNNILVGNSGANVLAGGLGADTLTGELGADNFLVRSIDESSVSPGAWDVITDFSRAEGDKLDLSRIDLNPLVKGRQGFVFIGAAEFTGSGQLRFDTTTGTLYGNANGSSAPEFAIRLIGTTTLDSIDLIL